MDRMSGRTGRHEEGPADTDPSPAGVRAAAKSSRGRTPAKSPLDRCSPGPRGTGRWRSHNGPFFSTAVLQYGLSSMSQMICSTSGWHFPVNRETGCALPWMWAAISGRSASVTLL